MPRVLPEWVTSKVRYMPVEDLVIGALSQLMPDLPVYTLVSASITDDFFVVVRREPSIMRKDESPIELEDRARVRVNCFVNSTEGDIEAGILSDAIRTVLREAADDNLLVPGVGYLAAFEPVADPAQVDGWSYRASRAMSSNTFADLPADLWHYSATYEIDHWPLPGQ